MIGGLAEHFDAQLKGGVRYFSSNIQVADDAGSYAGIISLGKIDAIQKVPGVAVALPSISLLAKPGSAGSTPLGLPDTIAYADPREARYSKLKTAVAAGRQLDPSRQREVVLGSDLASEFKVKVGDRLDLPIKPRQANPDFVNHPFKVVGILKKTNTVPGSTAAVSLLDAQMLLKGPPLAVPPAADLLSPSLCTVSRAGSAVASAASVPATWPRGRPLP